MNMNSNDISTPLESDWRRLEKMADEGIDYSNILPLRKGFFERAAVYVPASKRTANVQLDEAILVWFKAQSAEYQSLINVVLRKYMEVQQETAVS
jgi:uncharacterized protein (DUF4415 family)